jgi:hypothetical protein
MQGNNTPRQKSQQQKEENDKENAAEKESQKSTVSQSNSSQSLPYNAAPRRQSIIFFYIFHFKNNFILLCYLHILVHKCWVHCASCTTRQNVPLCNASFIWEM